MQMNRGQMTPNLVTLRNTRLRIKGSRLVGRLVDTERLINGRRMCPDIYVKVSEEP